MTDASNIALEIAVKYLKGGPGVRLATEIAAAIRAERAEIDRLTRERDDLLAWQRARLETIDWERAQIDKAERERDEALAALSGLLEAIDDESPGSSHAAKRARALVDEQQGGQT